MNSYLERVTECEHGFVNAHDYDVPERRKECPGGSRVRVEPDYEAAATALQGVIDYWQTSVVGPQGGHETEAFAAGIVDAALGTDE